MRLACLSRPVRELAKLWFEMDKHAFSGADLMRGFEQPEPVEMVAGEAMTFAERIASIEVGEGDTLVITAPWAADYRAACGNQRRRACSHPPCGRRAVAHAWS